MNTEWLERRRALGQDSYDEVWAGSYHVAPNARHEHGVAALQIMMELEQDARRQGLISTGPFNLGEGKDDFRVPDGAWTRGKPQGLYVPTAEAVLEVLSPDDETYRKVDFYFRRGVREVLIAHPTERWVRSATPPLTRCGWTSARSSAGTCGRWPARSAGPDPCPAEGRQPASFRPQNSGSHPVGVETASSTAETRRGASAPVGQDRWIEEVTCR